MPRRRLLLLLLALGGFFFGAAADVLPPEKLLPKDTALVVTMPDFGAAWKLLTNSPYGRLWNDAQLKPFRGAFIQNFTTNVITPLERNLDIRLSSFEGLARGQLTLAILPLAHPEKPDDRFGTVFILDAKDHASQLRTNLADIRRKWAAAGRPMKARRIREVDFTTFVVSSDDLSWNKILARPKMPIAEDDSARPTTNKVEITFGQSDSLLLVTDSPQALEKILSRQAGGLVPALEEQPAFQADYAARLRGAPFYAWVNIRDSVTALNRGDNEEPASPSLRTDSLAGMLGLTGLTSASFCYRSLPEGMLAQFFIAAPESQRRGLAKALVSKPADSSPPPCVPGDAVKYWRWRVNLPHAWSQIETTLNDANPQYASVINFILHTAGKEKDENYDLKSHLLPNLGDDLVHYEKAPPGSTAGDLSAPPSIYLIGSPDAEQLATALKTGLGFFGAPTEREFLGRQICTIGTPPQGMGPGRSLSFSGSGNYLAMSSDSAILEEFLRSDANREGKTLADTPGLADAAQRVGGMGTGLFGYENQNIGMRPAVDALRQQSANLQDVLGSSLLVSAFNMSDQVGKLREWSDFSLLPPYDAISQYFYFSVYAGAFSPEGFSVTYFAPTPPKLR